MTIIQIPRLSDTPSIQLT